ncbi:MAG: NADPH-dependent 7-cyano-7-deazaguanine reductase QueF [Bdellovibrionia bacterium]
MKTEALLNEAPLGKKSSYINTYSPSLLFPLPRQPKRDEIGITAALPFQGFDIWNGFELSWLNLKGKPVVAISEAFFPCDSLFLVESKSQKLYLNSFNNSRFDSLELVRTTIESDLSKAAQAPVKVKLYRLNEAPNKTVTLRGLCLDDLDIECTTFMPDPSTIETQNEYIEETVYTNLLKSNCLVTGQPDWGSIEISYRGKKIKHDGLLKYIVSLRDHNEFHEQCVERIFMDIQRACSPEWLTVYARYTRRGGLDINPYRTNRPHTNEVDNFRLIRQ